ncbi:MAG TPA: S8 family serine peptidase [Pyrinomonadaceae bacterium]|nr:S8 family serine peptidase [Pyrinomonadaceae bacterium]
MNRQNIWLHLGLAVGLIVIAAIIGQIRSWESQELQITQTSQPQSTKACATSRSLQEREPEVLVRFRQDVSLADIRKIAARNNDLLEDEIESVGNLVSIDDLDNRSPQQVAEEYKRLGDMVEYAEPNFQINLGPVTPVENLSSQEPDNAENLPNDPYFAVQWALRNSGQNSGKENADIDALKAWAKTKGKSDIVVAVLDTGVDYTHQDLIENIWQRPDSVPAYKDDELGSFDDLHGYNSAENSRDPMDDNGHGTHCAGVIGAEGDNGEGIAGINWKVQIMPLKFLGKGGFGTTKNAIESINYAIDRKKAGVNVRVISASWGSTQYSRALEDTIRKAGEEGILFVAAAGNASTDNDKFPHYPSSYKVPNVISVAALDRSDALASFSNYGAKTVHIAAPGKEIISTWIKSGYREASGTSMATPQVAGVAALVLSVEPNLSVEKLRERILKSVDRLDILNGKIENSGRLNAAKAIGE